MNESLRQALIKHGALMRVVHLPPTALHPEGHLALEYSDGYIQSTTLVLAPDDLRQVQAVCEMTDAQVEAALQRGCFEQFVVWVNQHASGGGGLEMDALF